MRAELKDVSADDMDIGSFVPADPKCFSIVLRLRIGVEGSSSGDDFELTICTPAWLQNNIWEPMWGRHFLVVREFNYQEIVNTISKGVVACVGGDWIEVAGKLARLFAWEFEDYQA